MQEANFPKDQEGRTWHLACKKGEIANRVITVGDPSRAKLFSSLLDDSSSTFIKISSRGFTVYTGKKNGVPVSIIATGMGFPMMDFVVREARAVVDGPMAFIRVGTCGCPNPNVDVGSVIVASKGSCGILRNPNHFGANPRNEPPYLFLDTVPANQQLSDSLFQGLQKSLSDPSAAIAGLNASSDTFYCAQGRVDVAFDDRNETMIADLMQRFPDCAALEMESFHLLDLARSSCDTHSIVATACAIVCSNVVANKVFDWSKMPELERACGIAALEAISSYKFPEIGRAQV